MHSFIIKTLLSIFLISLISCTKVTFKPVEKDSGSSPISPAPPASPPSPVSPLPPNAQRVDILIIIDNSSSMLPEHAKIEEKLKGFSKEIRHLNYQIAVTTTDARTNINSNVYSPRGFGGKGLSFNGKNFISRNTPNGENLILESLDRSLEASCGTSDVDDASYLKTTSQGEVCSTDYEEPIKVIQQFLQQKNTSNSGFLRSHSAFVALIITDEDLAAFSGKNADMAQLLQSIVAVQPNFKAYGVIAQQNDIANCQANWSGDISEKVQEFITLSGGTHQSICDNSYTAIFKSIAENL